MKTAARWLLGLALALWIGGCAASGDESNYKVLEEDPARFDPQPPGQQGPGAHILQALQQYAAATKGPGALAAADTTTPAAPGAAPATVTTEAVATQPEAKSEAEPVPLTAPAVATSPAEPQTSLRGLDRSHWPRLATGPVDGRTRHYPVYFEDLTIGKPEPAITQLATTQEQLVAAMNGAGMVGWEAENALGVVLQPLKFGADIVLLPVKMVVEPPWTPVTTP